MQCFSPDDPTCVSVVVFWGACGNVKAKGLGDGEWASHRQSFDKLRRVATLDDASRHGARELAQTPTFSQRRNLLDNAFVYLYDCERNREANQNGIPGDTMAHSEDPARVLEAGLPTGRRDVRIVTEHQRRYLCETKPITGQQGASCRDAVSCVSTGQAGTRGQMAGPSLARRNSLLRETKPIKAGGIVPMAPLRPAGVMPYGVTTNRGDRAKQSQPVSDGRHGEAAGPRGCRAKQTQQPGGDET